MKKTTSILTAFMVFCIQIMVNGQSLTNGPIKSTNQPLLSPTKKVSHQGVATYAIKKEHRRNKKADKKQNLPEPTISAIISEINQIDNQIAELQRLKLSLDNEISKYTTTEVQTRFTANTSSPSVKGNNAPSPDMVEQIDSYFELQNETEDLNAKYTQLICFAKTKSIIEREKLLAEANTIYKLYEIKRIEFSESTAHINYSKFIENKMTISTLLETYHGGIIVPKMVNQLSDEAEISIRMAKEMREEANAQPNNSAKLGTYSNAEEKETIALNKQGEAITMLEKTAHINFLNTTTGLTFNFMIQRSEE